MKIIQKRKSSSKDLSINQKQKMMNVSEENTQMDSSMEYVDNESISVKNELIKQEITMGEYIVSDISTITENDTSWNCMDLSDADFTQSIPHDSYEQIDYDVFNFLESSSDLQKPVARILGINKLLEAYK